MSETRLISDELVATLDPLPREMWEAVIAASRECEVFPALHDAGVERITLGARVAKTQDKPGGFYVISCEAVRSRMVAALVIFEREHGIPQGQVTWHFYHGESVESRARRGMATRRVPAMA